MALIDYRLLLALVLSEAALGCRRFDVCGTEGQPCERRGGAETLGGAGAGGEGSQGDDACSATHANCDRSTLNGCETDLQTSPRHCGACDRACAGVCTLGVCVPFEVRVPELYEPMANVLVTGSAAYFVGRPSQRVEAMSVGRYDLESGAVTWIAEGGWSDVTVLAGTATRLYVVGDNSLYSMPLPSGELRDEGLIWVESVSAMGTTAAVVADGEAYVRSGDFGEFALIRGDNFVYAVAATLNDVYVARDASDAGFSVEQHSLIDGTWDVIATGEGYARGLTVDEFGEAYVATESEFASRTLSLRRIESPGITHPLVEFSSDSLWLLTTSPSPLGGRAWVGTYSEGSRQGIRMVTLGHRPLSADWPTVGVVEGLSASGTELWFVDPLRHALVSIDLEAMIERAVAVPPTD